MLDTALDMAFKNLKDGSFSVLEYIQTGIITEGLPKDYFIKHVLDQNTENSLIGMLIKYERYEDCIWLISHCKMHGIEYIPIATETLS